MSAALNASFLRNNTALEWMPIALGLLALYIPTFYDLATSDWQQDDNAHGPIILAVTLWLVWDKHQILLAAPARAAPVVGLGFLVFGLLIYVLGRSHGITIFEVGALVPVLAGVLLAMRGWAGLRGYWFMLLFIVYLVPLPFFFVAAVTLPLKQTVSVTAEHLLYTAGYPIAHDGVTLSIGQYQLLVADACSGLNSMFSLSALGLLYLYVMRRTNWLHNSLVIASLLPIAFFANIVRVIILVLTTYHFGDTAGQGFVHGLSGLVLFVVALVAIVLLDGILAKVTVPAKPAR